MHRFGDREINAKGGVLGRQLIPVVVDGKSEITADSAFTRGAEKLLEADKVAAVFGGFWLGRTAGDPALF